MNGSSLARRYADGFLEYAKPALGLGRCLEELNDVKSIFKTNPGVLEFFASPAMRSEEKISFIEKIFAKDFSVEIRQFLEFLLRKGRIDHFVDMAEYARQKYAHGKEVDAVLKTSYPLDTDIIEKIKTAIENKFKVKLHLYIELDPDMLGGVKIVMGNKIIDGSVKKRFDELWLKLNALKVA